MFCPKCGNTLNDGAAFCPNCGNKIGVAAAVNNAPAQPAVNSAQPASTPKKSSKAWVVALIAVVAVIAVGFVGIKVFNTKPASTSSTGVVSSEGNSTPSGSTADVHVTPEPAAGAASDSAAVDELLGYLEQADEINAKVAENIAVIDEEDLSGYFKNGADSFLAAYTETENVKAEAAQISGLDSSVSEAGGACFDLMIGSYKSAYEIYDFFSNYLYAINSFLINRPDVDSYNDISAYYTDLDSWYQSSKEALAVNTQ